MPGQHSGPPASREGAPRPRVPPGRLARFGHSEHQTGPAMDVGDADGECALQDCFEEYFGLGPAPHCPAG